MQFLVEDVSAMREPSDEALPAYLADHAARYAIPGQVSFTQIYLSREGAIAPIPMLKIS